MAQLDTTRGREGRGEKEKAAQQLSNKRIATWRKPAKAMATRNWGRKGPKKWAYLYHIKL